MRILLIMLAVIAAIGAAGYVYWRINPHAFIIGSRVPPPRSQPLPPEHHDPIAETCTGEDARYVYREDPNVTLLLKPMPPGDVYASGAAASDYTNVGTLLFIVSAYGRDFPFVAAQSRGMTMSYLFPVTGDHRVAIPRGVDLLQLSAFDTTYRYYTGLPALDHAAPAHIIVPNLSRYFYDHGGEPRIEEPPGFFDFIKCEHAPHTTTITVIRPAH